MEVEEESGEKSGGDTPGTPGGRRRGSEPL